MIVTNVNGIPRPIRKSKIKDFFVVDYKSMNIMRNNHRWRVEPILCCEIIEVAKRGWFHIATESFTKFRFLRFEPNFSIALDNSINTYLKVDHRNKLINPYLDNLVEQKQHQQHNLFDRIYCK